MKQIRIGKLILKNPVMVASGTFGYGTEYATLANLDSLGAIVTKTVTLKPRQGNPQPRIHELSYGLINSIGLQNVGIEKFISEKLPALLEITATPIVVSIGGGVAYEFSEICEMLEDEKIGAIEANISCPNINHCKGGLISQSAKMTGEVVRAIRKKSSRTLIVKLSPLVTDITAIAKTAEDNGADAVSLINTIPAAFFDGKTKKISFGGLSGPCVKPVGLRMVYEVSQKVRIPVIGIGGIMCVEDAAEYLSAGAKAVQVGCANFIEPGLAARIAKELKWS